MNTSSTTPRNLPASTPHERWSGSFFTRSAERRQCSGGPSILLGIAILTLFFACSVVRGQQTDRGIPYPMAVNISEFTTQKVIYSSREQISFDIELTTAAKPPSTQLEQLRCELWIEQEVDPPRLMFTANARLQSRSKRFTLTLPEPLPPVQGTRGTLKLFDVFGRELAQAQTLFDVTDNWIPVMRLAAIQAWIFAHPDIEAEFIDRMVQRFRDQCINTLEMYSPFPSPYDFAPSASSWEYIYPGPGVKPVAASKLILWGKKLHAAGMKYLAYNENSAFGGTESYQFFQDTTDVPVATYFKNRNMYTPNSLAIAPLFGNRLSRSIGRYHWDGILMDSGLQHFIATSKGVDRQGRPLTNASPGHLAQQFLEIARQYTDRVAPDFKFIMQNATAISGAGVRKSSGRIPQWIRSRTQQLGLFQAQAAPDMYSLEIDPHNPPRDGRYPLTYEKLSVTLNGLIENTGRPLLAWASLTHPSPTEYSPAFLKPYMATYLASRTQPHDHYLFYTGALSDAQNAPVAQAFTRYNRFFARYSYYMTAPDISWETTPEKLFRFSPPLRVSWRNTVYKRPRPDGGLQYVIHLLNYQGSDHILDRNTLPEPVQHLDLTLQPVSDKVTVHWLDSDNPTLTPCKLKRTTADSSQFLFRVPPFQQWGILVIDWPRTLSGPSVPPAP